ncbi:hypothetical protein M407DRAFT_20028 [Tulasnella calospora MUT 4182]|uniref:DUF6533 domain-containing protein n=1 Tax=Tulasnella calospora MUT 4182 TaxID=1051891 RepID=A0A0C3QQS4_9AGAM|nr:hypothetical protein M407DRAFT_20028 [Tulasnella calospora MUT 4182]
MLGFPYAVRRWSSPDILNSPEDSLVAILKDPHRYVGLVEKTALERYVMLAATVIALWDWLTRMDMEISHIWTPGFRIQAMIIWNGLCFGVFPPGLRLLAIAPFRVAITICGSRLIINMRQAASAHISGSPMHASINRTIDGRPNGPEEPPASADHAEVPPPGAAPWLHLAKRIGLPPPLQADFEDPWYQPVMTLNVITQTVDHPAEAPRALPHPPPGMVWNSSRQPFNLSWSMAEPNRTVSLADESLAFRSVDSTQASGKASFFDVDDEVEASPVAFARARRNVLNV